MNDAPPFVLFGSAHLVVLAVISGTAVGLVRLARVGRREITVTIRGALAAALVALVTYELVRGVRGGWLTLEDALPFHLCDAAILLAVFGLITPRRGVAEVIYFWTASGTALAVLSPDLLVGFPRWEFLVFFGLHGLVIVAALVLVFGLGLAPRRGAPLRVFLITNAYAAVIGLVNLALGTNYHYLRAKPEGATLVDLFGPWPTYIFVGDALALVLFLVLGLPFRGQWRVEAQAERRAR
jgi:hypothetical integral membrane protein (TIGR02206 family)